MNPTNIRSGWWVFTDDCFVCCYNSKEEALDHIKFQKERMYSNKNWYIQYISMQFSEYQSFPCEE